MGGQSAARKREVALQKLSSPNLSQQITVPRQICQHGGSQRLRAPGLELRWWVTCRERQEAEWGEAVSQGAKRMGTHFKCFYHFNIHKANHRNNQILLSVGFSLNSYP